MKQPSSIRPDRCRHAICHASCSEPCRGRVPVSIRRCAVVGARQMRIASATCDVSSCPFCVERERASSGARTASLRADATDAVTVRPAGSTCRCDDASPVCRPAPERSAIGQQPRFQPQVNAGRRDAVDGGAALCAAIVGEIADDSRRGHWRRAKRDRTDRAGHASLMTVARPGRRRSAGACCRRQPAERGCRQFHSVS